MQNTTIREILQFETSPENLYNTLIQSELHSKLTQSEALIDARPGGEYTAYDGYIHGTITELIPYQKIAQTWIAEEAEWPQEHVSYVVFEFEPIENETKLKFEHRNIPSSLTETFRIGWNEYYWEPLKALFPQKK